MCSRVIYATVIAPTAAINGNRICRGEYRRLDKYLDTARILKRRTVSKELADQERVYVNGKIAKPSTDVKVGDTIKVIFGYRELTVNVTMIQKQANKNDASLMFEVVEEKLIKKEEVKDILAED